MARHYTVPIAKGLYMPGENKSQTYGDCFHTNSLLPIPSDAAEEQTALFEVAILRSQHCQPVRITQSQRAALLTKEILQKRAQSRSKLIFLPGLLHHVRKVVP